MRDGIDVRGRQPCLLSHVDKVSMCWNDPLKQNVSHTQPRDCSNHLSAATTVALWAGLPHPGASGNSPPHTLQREAESSHSIRKLKSKQVPVACPFFFFLHFWKLTRGHFAHIWHRKSAAIVRDLKESASLKCHNFNSKDMESFHKANIVPQWNCTELLRRVGGGGRGGCTVGEKSSRWQSFKCEQTSNINDEWYWSDQNFNGTLTEHLCSAYRWHIAQDSCARGEKTKTCSIN